VSGHRCGRSKRGFTLVELLVVVGVITILMGLVAAGVTALQRTAKIEASKAICQTFAAALEQYYQDYRAYPLLLPTYVNDLQLSTEFNDLFYDSGSEVWSRAGLNATVVYQMLLPIRGGPFLDTGAKTVRLRYPRDENNQPQEITVNDQKIMVLLDRFDEPINIAWTGMVKLKDSTVRHQGSIVPEGERYILTTRNETLTFSSDDLVWDYSTGSSLPLVLTGLTVWSSGPDKDVDTSDDTGTVTTGR